MGSEHMEFIQSLYLLAMVTAISAYLVQISFVPIGILAQSIVNHYAWCYYHEQQKIEIYETGSG